MSSVKTWRRAALAAYIAAGVALPLAGQFIGQAADDHLARRTAAEQQGQGGCSQCHCQCFFKLVAEPMHVHSAVTISWPAH